MRTELRTLGEFGLIDHLTKNFKITHPSTVKGIGDDAAVLDSLGKMTVVSTDMLVEGIHFDLAYVPLKHLGYKSVVVNLSDIYAMNAQPEQITVSIAVSNRFSVEALTEIYEGIRTACDVYGVDLIGGDTTSSPKGLVISITAIGTAAKEQLVYRNGAKPGDMLCVTGDLGGAYIGLQILEREKRIFMESPGVQPDLQEKTYVVGRQLKPEARKDIIEELAKAGVRPTAMMDISDGLSSEIGHICKQSGVGALVEEALVPVHPETYEMAAMTFQIDPLNCAFFGGEDYELLLALDPKDVDKVKYILDLKIIGEFTEASEGIKMASKSGKFHDLTSKGFNHFTEEQND